MKKSSHFIGYDTLETETRIHKVTRPAGKYQLVLEETPFYAEAGGQLGDRGKIFGEGFELQVIDTQREGDDIVHICVAKQPVEIAKPDVRAIVDTHWRYPTMYNHTATHLLHAALRRVLGTHVTQAGSLVTPDRLRFDFTHFKKIERGQLEEIEWLVNEKIREDIPIEELYTKFEEAQKMGAMALFGEKYEDWVRVVIINDFSKELCGGTHVRYTGEIGSFLFTQESSIASGVRRVEALTGPKATEFVQKSRDAVLDLNQLLNCAPEELSNRVEEMTTQIRRLEKQMQQMQAGQILDRVEEYLKNAEKLGTVSLVIEQFSNIEMDLLKRLGDRLRERAKNTVGFFINHIDNRLSFVCAVTDDLIQKKGLKAGELVKAAARIAGGAGGGRSHLATAGAKDPEKLAEVLAFLRKKLAEI